MGSTIIADNFHRDAPLMSSQHHLTQIHASEYIHAYKEWMPSTIDIGFHCPENVIETIPVGTVSVFSVLTFVAVYWPHKQHFVHFTSFDPISVKFVQPHYNVDAEICTGY